MSKSQTLKRSGFGGGFRSGETCKVVCRELLGCDLSIEEGRAQAKRDNLFKTICDEKVRNAVDLLDELGY